MTTGFLLINKPVGPTSHDIVDAVRRVSGIKKVGHAGTLDPFASGLLIVGVGAATKSLAKLVGLDKTYEAMFVLGATSDTDDRTGKIEYKNPKSKTMRKTEMEIRKAMEPFIGNIRQIPPAYAAIKIGGKKMYEEARKGKPLTAQARNVTIHRFELQKFELPRLFVNIHCSSGTYIRAIARDLGQALGVGGYVEELRRTAIGLFFVSESVPISALSRENWTEFLHPVETILDRLPMNGASGKMNV